MEPAALTPQTRPNILCPMDAAQPEPVQAKGLVLVVEDDKHTAEMMCDILKGEGYSVEAAMSLFRARGILERKQPQLVILDRKLPDGDGLDLCHEIRKNPPTQNIPVLFLTVKKSIADKVVGLKFGGDDYLCKPFSPEELLARVGALLRRTRLQPEMLSIFRAGDLEVHLEERRAYLKGRELQLRPREFDLLCAFLKRKNRVLTRRILLTEVWGYQRGVDLTTNTVDQTVSRLRENLGPYGSKIVPVRNYGYRFEFEE